MDLTSMVYSVDSLYGPYIVYGSSTAKQVGGGGYSINRTKSEATNIPMTIFKKMVYKMNGHQKINSIG